MDQLQLAAFTSPELVFVPATFLLVAVVIPSALLIMMIGLDDMSLPDSTKLWLWLSLVPGVFALPYFLSTAQPLATVYWTLVIPSLVLVMADNIYMRKKRSHKRLTTLFAIVRVALIVTVLISFGSYLLYVVEKS